MFAIIKTRWHTRPLSRRAKRRSSAARGSLRKKYTDIAPTRSCRSVDKLYHILGLREARITRWAVSGRDEQLKLPAVQNLIRQSRWSMAGFVSIGFGTLLQIFAVWMS
jgi:hypothetical protein